ncbi:Heterokaryon incompatibility protein (HET) domain containing protein [Hyaloscypha variabilis]
MHMYEPLPAGQCIRLIELHPDSRQSSVAVTFKVFKLEEAPDYDALSYVWGSPEKKGLITCNGHPFTVTANLLLALQRLQHKSDRVLLWADARNHQVAMMGVIYANARKVLVHIPGRNRSLGECLDVQELVEEVKRRVVESGGWSKMTEHDRLKDGDPLMKDLRWGSMNSFLAEEWFNRTWVLQEVGMARDPHVLYGECEFSYRDLMLLCRWLTSLAAQIHGMWKLSLPSTHLSALDWYCDDRTESPAYPVDSFIDMFNVASYHLCKDPRDHIYSLLHHPLALQPDGSLLIQPDYSRPEEDVYYEFAYQMVFRPEGLRLLGTIDNGDNDPPRNLPSWVPRWKDPTRRRDMCFAVGEDRTLSLHGILFDRIHSAFTIKTPKTEFGPNLSREFETMYSEIIVRESPYGSTIDRLDAFSITLTIGFLSRQGGVGFEQLKVHRANFEAFWKAGTNQTLYPENDLVGSADSFLADLLERFPNGSIFITEKGYIGYGGAFARQGDYCVIFQGGFAPFIVRRHDKTETFRLVSEAYVHGIMRGEVAPMVHAKGLAIQEIVLS